MVKLRRKFSWSATDCPNMSGGFYWKSVNLVSKESPVGALQIKGEDDALERAGSVFELSKLWSNQGLRRKNGNFVGLRGIQPT